LLTVSRSFMNVANSVLWKMAIILKANKVYFFVSSVLFVFWYHSLNVLDTPRMTNMQTYRHVLTVRIQTAIRSYLQIFINLHLCLFD
jgi:hypothetical protein